MNTNGLMKHLETVRGYPVTQPTFYRWLTVCGIPPKGRRGYSPQDCDRMTRLVIHLRHGGTYEAYQEILIQEELNSDYETTATATNEPITVAVSEVD